MAAALTAPPQGTRPPSILRRAADKTFVGLLYLGVGALYMAVGAGLGFFVGLFVYEVLWLQAESNEQVQEDIVRGSAIAGAVAAEIWYIYSVHVRR